MIDKETRKVISQNLRKIMRQQGLTEQKLSQISGLNSYQIGNIMHCRACPESSVKKIAAGLSISVSTLFRKNKLDFNNKYFNIDMYNKLSQYISEFIKSRSLYIFKEQMDRVIYTVYKNHRDFKDPQDAINAIMLHLYEQGDLQEKE